MDYIPIVWECDGVMFGMAQQERIPYFAGELNDEQLAGMDAESLRDAYRQLLQHHIAETSALWQRLREARK